MCLMFMEGSLPASNHTRLMAIMGVAGCGKSTFAEGLAFRLGGTHLDRDSFHPTSIIAKISAGKPLTDEDRWPCLSTFAREISRREVIVAGACSALKKTYRDLITIEACEPVLFIHLNGSRELVADRMSEQREHFMPTSLLDSQFSDLEIPNDD